MKQYKPNPLKPKDTNMWSPVNITGWNLGGESNIQTQFSYTSKINSMLTRAVPNKKDANGTLLTYNFLNYLSIPTLAYYGKVTINPAGVAAYVDGSQTAVFTDNLRESLVSAYNARSYIINRQLTNLRIASDDFGLASQIDFPIIMSYVLALIHNTQTLVMPALHFKTLMGFLDSLEGFSNQAAVTITQIRNKFAQNKFLKVCNQYMDMISQVPLHTTTIDSLLEFIAIEKLNDAFNTSYDYVTIEDQITRYNDTANDMNYEDIFSIDDNGAVTNILLADIVGQKPMFKNRDYILNMLKIVNAKATEASTLINSTGAGTVNELVDAFIEYFNNAISAISALPTIFGPFYEAVPFLSDFLDTSIFKVRNIKDLEIPVRKSCYYAKGSVISGVSIKEAGVDSLYPTYTATIPLYNGSLEPSDTFKGNGLLYISNYKWDSTQRSIKGKMYIPFVDISEMNLTNFVIFTNKETIITDYLDPSKTKKLTYNVAGVNGTLDMYQTTVSSSGITGIPEILVKGDAFSTDVANKVPYISVMNNVISPLVHWATAKGDYVSLRRSNAGSGSGAAMLYSSPLLTGARTVEMLPIDDAIRKATPSLVGIKAVPHIK